MIFTRAARYEENLRCAENDEWANIPCSANHFTIKSVSTDLLIKTVVALSQWLTLFTTKHVSMLLTLTMLAVFSQCDRADSYCTFTSETKWNISPYFTINQSIALSIKCLKKKEKNLHRKILMKMSRAQFNTFLSYYWQGAQRCNWNGITSDFVTFQLF